MTNTDTAEAFEHSLDEAFGSQAELDEYNRTLPKRSRSLAERREHSVTWGGPRCTGCPGCPGSLDSAPTAIALPVGPIGAAAQIRDALGGAA